MTDQVPAAAAAEATPAPQGAGATGEQPGSDWKRLADEYKQQADEYKQRFTGMQSKYQQELAKWTEQNDQATTRAKTLEAQVQQLSGVKEGAEMQLKALQEQHETATGELDILKDSHERLRLITGEFNDLLQFEAQGLLPDGNGEELRGKLSTFRDMLGKQGKQEALKQLEGLSPAAAPKEGSAPSVDDAWATVLKAMQSDDPAVYDEAYNEYMKLSTKEG